MHNQSLRYGLYARKSRIERSETIKSIEDQKSALVELANRAGLSIVKTYEENMSAKVPGKRPVYQQLVKDLQVGRINAVLVWHVNRLARNVQEGGEFGQLLIDGIIREIRTPFQVYTPADNILPLLLEQGSATQQSRDLARTITLAMDEMAKNGGWPHRAPLGYLNVRDPKNARRGSVTVDPERFPLVRRAFDLLMTGRFSVRDVVVKMNEWGLRTRLTDQRGGIPVTDSTAYLLFRNPFYAGLVRHRGALIRGTHQPMLTLAEFDRVQQAIAAHYTRRTRRGETYAFTGLLRCGVCNQRVTAETRQKKGRTYVYYHCSDSYGRCSKRAIRAEALEQQFARVIARFTIDEDMVAFIHAQLAVWQEKAARHGQTAMVQQKARLEEIAHERERLLSLLVRGVITDESIYQAKDAALHAEQYEVERALEREGQSTEQVVAQGTAVLEFAASAYQQFLTADAPQKKAIVSALGTDHELRDRQLYVNLHPALTHVMRIVKKLRTQKTAPFEPPETGSGSRSRPSFSPSICFGGPKSLEIELNEFLKIVKGTGFRVPSAQPEDEDAAEEL